MDNNISKDVMENVQAYNQPDSDEVIEFDVQMDAGILYDYMLYHSYRSFIGILGTVIGLLLLANFISRREISFLIFGLIILLYMPWSLFITSRRQMLSVAAYKNPLHYRLGSDGIKVSQGEETQGHEWGAVVKVCADAKSIFVYTGRNVATIFPRQAMGAKTEQVIRMISRFVPPSKVKIRY